MVARALNSEAKTLYDYGYDGGSNVHLVALIAVRRRLLAAASPNDERGAAHYNLGTALWALGERESVATRLEEAVAACRAALEQWGGDRAPLDWATAQNNFGNALRTLGERERGTARLEKAVVAFHGVAAAALRSRAARLGDDAEQPRQRASDARVNA
jgi:tetratricopeptide (TPR) repeat protein